eukprot:gene5510-11105_t
MSRLGPRAKLLEAKLKQEVEGEFKEREIQEEIKRSTADYSTTFRQTYMDGPFNESLIIDDPSVRVPTINSNYVAEPGISYYSYSASHPEGNSKYGGVSFPVSAIGSANPFRRTCNFTADMSDPCGNPSETFNHPSRVPALADWKLIKAVRARILKAMSPSTANGLPGSTTRSAVALLNAANDGTGFIKLNSLADLLESKTGATLAPKDIEALRLTFDHKSENSLAIRDFIIVLRDGPLSSRNQELVQFAYSRCGAATTSDSMPISEVKTCINSDDLLRSSENKQQLSAKVALELFMTGLGVYAIGDSTVGIASFLEYYSDVYAELQDDEAFESLIKATYGL